MVLSLHVIVVQGPSAEARAKGYFRYNVIGTTASVPPKQVYGIVSGGDPGYTDTAKMLSESGIALALNRDELPGV